jgi:acyl-CoA thioesterase-1
MLIKPDDTILFTGDSITDAGRSREDFTRLGDAYVAFTASRIQMRLASPKLKIYNRGIGGNRMRDLLARQEEDLFALKPTVISILMGINDVWRRYDKANDPTPLKNFKADYATILRGIRERLDARVILLEPFLLHVPNDRYQWREDLNPKIDAVRELAVEFGTELLPLDGLFASKAAIAPAAYWAADGVHPTWAGHALIAEAWLQNAGLA